MKTAEEWARLAWSKLSISRNPQIIEAAVKELAPFFEQAMEECSENLKDEIRSLEMTYNDLLKS